MSFLPALLGAAGSIAGGFFGGSSTPKETKNQRTQRKLIDQLISSLSGNGPYSDLYNADEEAFQKSFVDPAKSMFNNQIAPQIQQQFIASGQQRGTSLDDQLLRAGVDLDSMINQHFSEFQQGAQNRKQNAISSILGGSSGAQSSPSTGDIFKQSVGGYLSSPLFSDAVSGMYRQNQNPQLRNRRGFEADMNTWGQL